MEKYFWREKNANYYLEKCQVLSLSNEELFEEIVKKFEDKLEMINVIFDKEKRNEYLKKKNKSISSETPETIIKQKIGTRLIVDFLQLIKDLSFLKKINITFSETETNIKNEFEIYNSLKIEILNLKTNTNKSLNKIFNIVLYFIRFLSLDYDKLEIKRKEIEGKEGSFLKGKIVIK